MKVPTPVSTWASPLPMLVERVRADFHRHVRETFVAQIGEQLLQRTGRGVKLTEAGELLFRQADTILQEAARRSRGATAK